MKTRVKKWIGVLISVYCRFRKRLSGRTELLFYGNNVMNYTMFRPMFRKIEQVSDTRVFFCFDMPEPDYSGFIRLGVPPAGIITLAAARKRVWDAIVYADFRRPSRLWTHRTVYICHGVAAKKCSFQDETGKRIISDYRYHHYLKQHDLIFFHNEEDYRNAEKRNLLKHRDAGHIVGMSCLDEILEAARSAETLQSLRKKIIPRRFQERKVILYAPTWSETSSFQRKGREILCALSESDAFVIVKPHPLCITSEVAARAWISKRFFKSILNRGIISS